MKAWELLDSPEKWSCGSFARDKYCLPIGIFTKAACSYCAVGAIRKAYKASNRPEIIRKLGIHLLANMKEKDPSFSFRENAGTQYYSNVIFTWNDTTGWYAVYTTMKELDI